MSKQTSLEAEALAELDQVEETDVHIPETIEPKAEDQAAAEDRDSAGEGPAEVDLDELVEMILNRLTIQ
ncbi:MAG: hypothetical protein ACLFVN_09775 [Phycisphaeraceae bacterium]